MQITPEEIIKQTEIPIQLFYDSLKRPTTRTNYVNHIKKLVCEYLQEILKGNPETVHKDRIRKTKGRRQRKFSDADFEERTNEFVRKAKADPVWVENILLTVVRKLMDKVNLPLGNPDRIQSITIQNVIKPTKKLFKMNNVPLSWTRIDNIISDENDVMDKSMGYEREHIQKILKHCDPMEAVIVYLGASSGIRAGALSLNWGDIYPVYRVNDRYLWEPQELTESISENSPVVCGIIRVYASSYAEYYALFTPECWKAIQLYKETWIKETNKIPRPSDQFFKKSGHFVRKLGYGGIRKRLDRVVDKSGIRKKLPEFNERYDIPLFNGLRRFFNKTNKKSLSQNSLLASLILKENMMGHSGLIKLDKNYFKEHIQELIEEYLNAVPNLTISDEERLRAKNTQLRKEKEEFEKKEIRLLKKDMKKMKKDMELMSDYSIVYYEKDPKRRSEKYRKFCEKYNLDPRKSYSVKIRGPKNIAKKLEEIYS